MADDPQAVLAQVVELLANHRVWERFPTTQEVAADLTVPGWPGMLAPPASAGR